MVRQADRQADWQADEQKQQQQNKAKPKEAYASYWANLHLQNEAKLGHGWSSWKVCWASFRLGLKVKEKPDWHVQLSLHGTRCQQERNDGHVSSELLCLWRTILNLLNILSGIFFLSSVFPEAPFWRLHCKERGKKFGLLELSRWWETVSWNRFREVGSEWRWLHHGSLEAPSLPLYQLLSSLCD